jgi:anhydro-N-acetylmuramic acid kinase
LKRALIKSGTDHLSPEDILATLGSFSAHAIALALENLPTGDYVIYASGGGIYNKVLMAKLRELLPKNTIKTTQSLGINPDAKEAVLFAGLANECIAGNPVQIGKLPALRLGKISLPD